MRTRPRVRRAAVVLLALGSSLVLSACAGSPTPVPSPPPGIDAEGFEGASGNGLWLVPSAELPQRIVDAVHAAGPVVVQGTAHEFRTAEDGTLQPGRTISVDYRGRADAFAATLAAGDVEAQLLVDEGRSRVRGNEAYAAASGRADLTAVQCTVGVDPAVAQWSPFTDPALLVETLLSGAELSVAPPSGDGETLSVRIGSSDSVAGVLTVERYGAPLPRSISIAEPGGDTELSFSAWGEPADLDSAGAALPCP